LYSIVTVRGTRAMNDHILRRSSEGRAGKRVKVGDVSSIVVVVVKSVVIN
jgi:hypothetical protein